MIGITDAQINEITQEKLGEWPSFEAQSWACKVAHAVLGSDAVIDVSIIPEGWFLWGLYHQHSRIIYPDQAHVPFSPERNGQEPWAAAIQHVTGGEMQEGTGATPQLAILDALSEVYAWENIE